MMRRNTQNRTSVFPNCTSSFSKIEKTSLLGIILIDYWAIFYKSIQHVFSNFRDIILVIVMGK